MDVDKLMNVEKVLNVEKVPNNRVGKATKEQFEIMLNFMESHANLLTGKLTTTYTSAIRRKDWEELSSQLNAMARGPKKDADKWRKTWNDWKSYVKAKALRIRKEEKSGGPLPSETLTSLEERLVMAMRNAPMAVEGNDELSETCGVEEVRCEQSMTVDTSMSAVLKTNDGERYSVVAVDDRPQPTNPQQQQHQQQESESASTETDEILPDLNETYPPSPLLIYEEPAHSIHQQRTVTNEEPARKKRKLQDIDPESLAGLFSSAQQQSAAALDNISVSLKAIAHLEERRVEAEEKKAMALEKIANTFANFLEHLNSTVDCEGKL